MRAEGVRTQGGVEQRDDLVVLDPGEGDGVPLGVVVVAQIGEASGGVGGLGVLHLEAEDARSAAERLSASRALGVRAAQREHVVDVHVRSETVRGQDGLEQHREGVEHEARDGEAEVEPAVDQEVAVGAPHALERVERRVQGHTAVRVGQVGDGPPHAAAEARGHHVGAVVAERRTLQHRVHGAAVGRGEVADEPAHVDEQRVDVLPLLHAASGDDVLRLGRRRRQPPALELGVHHRVPACRVVPSGRVVLDIGGAGEIRPGAGVAIQPHASLHRLPQLLRERELRDLRQENLEGARREVPDPLARPGRVSSRSARQHGRERRAPDLQRDVGDRERQQGRAHPRRDHTDRFVRPVEVRVVRHRQRGVPHRRAGERASAQGRSRHARRGRPGIHRLRDLARPPRLRAGQARRPVRLRQPRASPAHLRFATGRVRPSTDIARGNTPTHRRSLMTLARRRPPAPPLPPPRGTAAARGVGGMMGAPPWPRWERVAPLRSRGWEAPRRPGRAPPCCR